MYTLNHVCTFESTTASYNNTTFNNCSLSPPCNFFTRKPNLPRKFFSTVTFCSSFSRSESDSRTGARCRCALEVLLLALKHFKLQIAFGDPSNRAMWFLPDFQLLLDFASHLPDCVSAQLHVWYSAPFWQSTWSSTTDLAFSRVHHASHGRRSLTELTDHFLFENSLQVHFASHNKVNQTVFVAREQHAYRLSINFTPWWRHMQWRPLCLL